MKRILITPLDWGLGHATRCIPIVRELVKRNCTVFIAGSGDSLALLKNEFPFVGYFMLPGYRPVYSSTGNMIGKMISQIPKFMSVIMKEHREVESIVKTYKIDLIISDNRYGCWSSQVNSVFITHQLNILMPKSFRWLSNPINFFNKRLVKKFSRCWIPDYPDEKRSLSGKLSYYDKNFSNDIVHIGPLSRFKASTAITDMYDIVCILSGPEPQRSILEHKVISQLRDSSLRYFVVRGIVGPEDATVPNEAPLLNSEALQNVILQSSLVIARSGYSTIMDLAALGKKGILIPTPGQTEQEYLADRWRKRGVLYSMPQDSFNLQLALKESNQYTGFNINGERPTELLKQELDQVLVHHNLSNGISK